MQTNVQEFYAQNVLPMSEKERLKLAALIIDDLSNKLETKGSELKSPTKKGDITRLFGKVDLGYPTGANNESIDADLVREYINTHEDEN